MSDNTFLFYASIGWILGLLSADGIRWLANRFGEWLLEWEARREARRGR